MTEREIGKSYAMAEAERELLAALALCRKECAVIASLVPNSSSGQAAQRAVNVADEAIRRYREAKRG